MRTLSILIPFVLAIVAFIVAFFTWVSGGDSTDYVQWALILMIISELNGERYSKV